MQIEIPDDCEKIHVLFSGGMDSSILLYKLSKTIITLRRSIPITTHSFRGNLNLPQITSVLNFIDVRLNLKIPHRTHPGHFNIRDISYRILTVDPGYLFSGCNKVVDDKFTPTVYIPGDTPPVRGPALNEFHRRPFINLDKIEILRMYIEEDVLDLLPLTHSCGIKQTERCNGCYFCLERKWATDALNVIDI
jgi:hypothetical protein